MKYFESIGSRKVGNPCKKGSRKIRNPCKEKKKPRMLVKRNLPSSRCAVVRENHWSTLEQEGGSLREELNRFWESLDMVGAD